jgi:Tol biopolymer transport system component
MTREIMKFAWVLLAVSACDAPGPAVGDSGSPSTFVSLQSDSTPDYTPSAGPGGQIVFARVVEGLSNVFIADSAGRNPRQLTRGIWDFGPRWSPDGKYIAFNRETNGNDILVVPVDSGSERVLVSTPAREEFVNWLPDGSGLVYRKFGSVNELWLAKLDGSTTRLVDANASVDGMISPDGKSLGYARLDKGRWTLWLQDLATKATRQLTTEGFEQVDDAYGMWSPDSRRFLYVSNRSGTADVWSIDVTTGATRQLTRDVREDFRPLYSPDGRYVSFLSQRGGQIDTWVVADTGGEPIRITDNREQEARAEWTRDSRALLVETQMGKSQLYRASIDGGTSQRLLNDSSMQELEFTMSADGSQLAFSATDGVNLDVRAVPSAGGASTLLAGGPADEVSPAMSPDGKQVAFMSNRGGNFDLHVAPIGGDSARRLLDWPSLESHPRWSPDGKWIAFVSSRVSDNDIWLVRPDGTGARQLTTNKVLSTITSSAYEWSHDGRFIAYTSPAAAGASIDVIDVETGARRSVVSGQYADGLFWPGDSLLTVTNLADGFARLELRRVRDGSLVQSLSATSGNVYERGGFASRDGRWYVLSQFTFKGNDYLPAVRMLDGSNMRILARMQGSTRQMRFLPDGKTVLFAFGGDIPRLARYPLKLP